MSSNLFALYVHWPFCASKCPYCDFNSHVADAIDHAAWREAYERELQYYASLTSGRTITSIFFGGGTPSLMQPETVEHVINTAQKLWRLSNSCEITLEANPTSTEIEKFRAFRQAGVNRVSVGVQSFDDEQLKFLGRQHNAGEAIKAIETAARVFDRYSFDLIYARPDQTTAQWKKELEQALPYAGDHLSLYQLTIEPGTAFHTRFHRGEFTLPPDEEAGDLYELTQDMLARRGLPAYEISNHARPGQESLHNLTYWRYGDYVGVGPGAHGRLILNGRKMATRAHRAPEIWLQKTYDQGHGAHPFEEIDRRARFEETLMMGLRLGEGIPLQRLTNEAGQDWQTMINPQKIKVMQDENMLVVTDAHMSATNAGRQRLNGLLSFLLS